MIFGLAFVWYEWQEVQYAQQSDDAHADVDPFGDPTLARLRFILRIIAILIASDGIGRVVATIDLHKYQNYQSDSEYRQQTYEHSTHDRESLRHPVTNSTVRC